LGTSVPQTLYSGPLQQAKPPYIYGCNINILSLICHEQTECC